jgi:hypothetical protein
LEISQIENGETNTHEANVEVVTVNRPGKKWKKAVKKRQEKSEKREKVQKCLFWEYKKCPYVCRPQAGWMTAKNSLRMRSFW